MMALNIAVVILVIFDLYTLRQLYKHEQAICELLMLHPELLEEEEANDHD